MFRQKEEELDLTELKNAITSYSRPGMVPLDHRKKLVLSACLSLLSSEGYYIKEKLAYFGKVDSNDDLINYFYVRLSMKYNIFPVRDFTRDRGTALQFVGRIINDFKMTDDQARALCVELIHILFDNIDQFNFISTAYNSFSVFGQNGLKWVTDKALSILNNPETKEEKDIAIGDLAAEKYLKMNEVELGYDLNII